MADATTPPPEKDDMASSRRVAANRENAKRSTGPRTSDGKAVSSRNALKHGLLAREVLLASENAGDLEDLAGRLRSVLRPADDLEALLVDRIVTCAWRLRRALQAEAAELDLAQAAVLRPAEDDTLALLSDRMGEDGLRSERRMLRYAEETVSWLKDGADPLENCEDQDEDPLADALQTLADRDFPDLLEENDGEPARKVRHHVRALGWPAARLREAVLGILEERVRELRRRLKDHEQRGRLALRARAVPGDGSGAPLDRLLRYETAIERSLYRALHELHRLQAARAGDAMPPPVEP